ncbi:dihydroxy-acid dehydratase [uncultured Pelagimonas sp.]|uniref:dihydroxy-acid dehydratase n=1 Tax=uncultured Pelagimonas sp. TaxID=1618102 RepID=UPI0026023A16|nr:dihydroxy-acid dehydratase [uncultured Pelagimonas sp.]
MMRVIRFCAAVMMALSLMACEGGIPDSKPDSQAKPASNGFLSGILGGSSDKTPGAASKTKPPLARASLAGGDVVVAGHDGYCIDPVTKQSSQERGFALIASCHILSDGKVGAAVEPLLITVTVGPKGKVSDLPTPQQLAVTAGAPLLGGETGDGFVVANLDGGGDAQLQGGDKKHWRGAFLQGDRLVGLALYAPKGSPYAGAKGGGALRKLHSKIASLSPSASSMAAETTQPAKKPQEETLMGRLFKR